MKFVFLSCLFFIIICSCSNSSEEKKQSEKDWSDEKSIIFNKEIIEEQDLTIRAYLSHRTDLKMKTSGTGLRYMIDQKGDGEKAKPGDSVSIVLSVKNLEDMKLIYQTDPSEFDQFLIDRNHVESGINEAVQYMRVGDKSKLIIPSHLAHGLIGDRHKTPPLCILFVELELKELSR